MEFLRHFDESFPQLGQYVWRISIKKAHGYHALCNLKQDGILNLIVWFNFRTFFINHHAFIPGIMHGVFFMTAVGV